MIRHRSGAAMESKACDESSKTGQQSSSRVFAALATADAARCCTCATVFSSKIEGDPQSPLNHGRLCPIGTVTVDLVNHPDRLQYPHAARRSARFGPVGRASPGTKRSTRSPNAYSRSARNLGPRPSRSAPAPAAITSAGYRGSVTRSVRRTGASRASLNAFIRASTPAC